MANYRTVLFGNERCCECVGGPRRVNYSAPSLAAMLTSVSVLIEEMSSGLSGRIIMKGLSLTDPRRAIVTPAMTRQQRKAFESCAVNLRFISGLIGDHEPNNRPLRSGCR